MPLIPEPPDPALVLARLKKAVLNNESPVQMLYSFLVSGSKEANILGNIMIDNRESLKFLTSPTGRKWLHRWLDHTLDYLRKYAEEAE